MNKANDGGNRKRLTHHHRCGTNVLQLNHNNESLTINNDTHIIRQAHELTRKGRSSNYVGEHPYFLTATNKEISACGLQERSNLIR